MSANRFERGGAGIEFVLVLPVFFMVFYAIANYSMIFSANQMLQYSAEEGLRNSISFVDESCFFSTTECDSAAVRAQVELATKDVLGQVTGNATESSLGSLFGQSLDAALQIRTGDTASGGCCLVELVYDYAAFPFLPALMLPVPERLSTTASLNL